MGIQLSDWVENIVGKGEIVRYEQFLLFPQCFQNEYVWSKGLKLKAYKLFEDSDADLPWLLFFKEAYLSKSLLLFERVFVSISSGIIQDNFADCIPLDQAVQ